MVNHHTFVSLNLCIRCRVWGNEFNEGSGCSIMDYRIKIIRRMNHYNEITLKRDFTN